MKRAGVFWLFTSLNHVLRASCLCYNPDGTLASSTFQPCQHTEGSISMCCALNRSNPPGGVLSDGYTQDICLQNGLCQNNFEIANSNGTLIPGTNFYRESCSTPDWSECLSICLDEEDSNQDAQLTPCDGTNTSAQWCCGSNTDCCGTTNAITVSRTFGASTSSGSSSLSGSSPTSTGTGASNPTTTPLPSTSSNSTSRGGLSAGAAAGIAVGATIGLVVVVGAAFFVGRWSLHKTTPALPGAVTENTQPAKIQHKPSSVAVTQTIPADGIAQTQQAPDLLPVLPDYQPAELPVSR